MAKKPINLSKTTEGHSSQRLSCTYRFHNGFNHPPRRRVSPHQHECWHVDVMREGDSEVVFGDSLMSFSAGSCVFVPAGVRHEFRGGGRRWKGWSVKFAMAGCPSPAKGWVVPIDNRLRPLTDLLQRHLPEDRMVEGAELAVVDHLLAALISMQWLPCLAPPPGLHDRLVRLVRERGGRPLTVREAGERLGLSPSRLTTRMREEADTSPKEVIDHIRADIAGRRLRYTDENVGEVADALGFSDIYSFSRFYKRVTGTPPSKHLH